jgi:hypothetical protein
LGSNGCNVRTPDTIKFMEENIADTVVCELFNRVVDDSV